MSPVAECSAGGRGRYNINRISRPGVGGGGGGGGGGVSDLSLLVHCHRGRMLVMKADSLGVTTLYANFLFV